jgi:RNA polymerase sigma-70 factor (ECF subfamily)
MVLTLAQRVLGSRSEAEDLTQEVFSRVFLKAAQLRDPESLRSFVYSFAINALKSDLRKRKLRAWLPLDAVPALWDETRDVESRELLRRFHSLLDRLSTRDRLVFVLRRMEDMTIEEIATHLDVSPSTVKRSLSYASERLTCWIGADTDLLGLLGSRGSAP